MEGPHTPSISAAKQRIAHEFVRHSIRIGVCLIVSFYGCARETCAQNCIDYSEFIHWAGQLTTPGFAHDLAVAGSLAYVTTYDPGSLDIIDISAPQHPAVIGSIAFPNGAWGVTLRDSLAFVVTGSYSPISGVMAVVDARNPASPAMIAELPLSGVPTAITRSNDVAYVACLEETGWGSVSVVEVSNPSSPQLVGTVVLPGWPAGVVVQGSLVYVALRYSELLVIDASDPSSPYTIGGAPLSGELSDVELFDEHLYVSAKHNGLYILELSDPSLPFLIATANTPHAMDVTLRNGMAFVTNSYAGLSLVDVSDPQEPNVIGTLAVTGFSNGVGLTSTHVFIADGMLESIDLGNLSFPLRIGQALTKRASGLACSEAIACVGATGSISLVDISAPDAPEVLSSMLTPGVTYGLDLNGDHVYVADGEPGLQVVDISNPTMPQIIGSADTPSEARNVHVVGSYAYVADWAGLQVIDVTPPQLSRIIGSVPTPGFCLDVTVKEPYAYLACYDAGVKIVDISNPIAPHIVSGIALDYAGSVALRGNLLYVRGGEGFTIVDIANPLAPDLLGTAEMPGGVGPITLTDREAYVATSFDVHVFDVADPERPELIGSLGDYEATGVEVVDEYVIVADAQGLSTYLPHCAVQVGVGLTSSPSPREPQIKVFPNPLPNGESLSVSYEASVAKTLRIYDIEGRLIRLMLGYPNGEWTGATWDRRDSSGKRVAAGVYFLRIGDNQRNLSARVVLSP